MLQRRTAALQEQQQVLAAQQQLVVLLLGAAAAAAAGVMRSWVGCLVPAAVLQVSAASAVQPQDQLAPHWHLQGLLTPQGRFLVLSQGLGLTRQGFGTACLAGPAAGRS
jgi:hypothetical protein